MNPILFPVENSPPMNIKNIPLPANSKLLESYDLSLNLVDLIQLAKQPKSEARDFLGERLLTEFFQRITEGSLN